MGAKPSSRDNDEEAPSIDTLQSKKKKKSGVPPVSNTDGSGCNPPTTSNIVLQPQQPQVPTPDPHLFTSNLANQNPNSNQNPDSNLATMPTSNNQTLYSNQILGSSNETLNPGSNQIPGPSSNPNINQIPNTNNYQNPNYLTSNQTPNPTTTYQTPTLNYQTPGSIQIPNPNQTPNLIQTTNPNYLNFNPNFQSYNPNFQAPGFHQNTNSNPYNPPPPNLTNPYNSSPHITNHSNYPPPNLTNPSNYPPPNLTNPSNYQTPNTNSQYPNPNPQLNTNSPNPNTNQTPNTNYQFPNPNPQTLNTNPPNPNTNQTPNTNYQFPNPNPQILNTNPPNPNTNYQYPNPQTLNTNPPNTLNTNPPNPINTNPNPPNPLNTNPPNLNTNQPPNYQMSNTSHQTSNPVPMNQSAIPAPNLLKKEITKSTTIDYVKKKCRKRYNDKVKNKSDQEKEAYFTMLTEQLTSVEWLENQLFDVEGDIIVVKLLLIPVSPSLLAQVIKLTGSSYGYVHTGIQINNKVVDWDATGLIVPRHFSYRVCAAIDIVNGGVKSVTKTPELVEKVVQLIVKWNSNYDYGALRRNCQHFVNDLLEAINIDIQWNESIEGYIQQIKKDPDNATPHVVYYKNGKKERKEFHNHEELDKFILEFRQSDSTQYQAMEGLLKAFDRGFWFRDKKNPNFIFPAMCPFAMPTGYEEEFNPDSQTPNTHLL